MSASYERLREVIARLRAPGGCPWDREQTPLSLIPSLIEEAHEVADAIERDHARDLEEELGDLLINVLMQTEIAAERGAFTAESVSAVAAENLIRRHPHVFGDSTAETSDAVLSQWEEIKKAEREARTGDSEELRSGDRARLAAEVGDHFFSVVNLARALSLDSESLLRGATGKFERRFRSMESSLPEGREFRDLTFAEMDLLWESAKSAENAGNA